MAAPVSFRGFLLDADNTIFDFDAAERDALLATVDAPAAESMAHGV